MNPTECNQQWGEIDQIPTTDPECPPVYYDVGRQTYWVQNDREEWITVNESSLKRQLRKLGFSATKVDGAPLSPLDECFNDIQRKRDVAYAGPLAGYRKGPVEIGGQRILVTSSYKLIVAEERPYPVLKNLLTNMFGVEQFDYFKAWLKIGYEALANDTPRPGQALVLAGPRDSCKSLLQSLITCVLGGRSSKPYRYMSGGTEFNGDLFGAEHQMIEDDIGSWEIRIRRNFGCRIKEFTVNDVQSCHAKNRQALSLTPFWRLTISVNDEPENLMILPPLDDSLQDKLILLKVSKQPSPLPTVTHEERKKFWQTLMDELPGFIWDIVNWEIPAAMQSGRFAIRHFHHPGLLQAIEESTPEAKLLALIDAAFKEDEPRKDSIFSGTAEELESILADLYPNETRRLLGWSNAAGTYLGRLAEKHPDRVKQKRTANSRLWEVKRAAPMTP